MALLNFFVLFGAAQAVLQPQDCPHFVVVQDVKYITPLMKTEIVLGIKRMKSMVSAYDPAWNAYDYFADMHRRSTLPGVENHAMWAFPFWHRAFMHRWNSELQRATNNSKLVFPYWDFNSTASLAAWLDDDTYIGGRGDQTNGYVLQTGNLRAAAGFPIYANATDWPQSAAEGAILRSVGNGIQMCMDNHNEYYVLESIFNHQNQDMSAIQVGPFIYLPDMAAPVLLPNMMLTPQPNNCTSWGDENCMRYYANSTFSLTCKHYAARLQSPSPACMNPWLPFTLDSLTTLPTMSYRPCLEGIDWSDVFARGLERLGASLHPPHGQAHQYIGGGLNQPTAPSDPGFAHIHMNVDRLFRTAQLVAAAATPPAWQFDAATLGRNIALFTNPTITIGEYLDTQSLGYIFDTDTCPPPPPSPPSSKWVLGLLEYSVLAGVVVAGGFGYCAYRQKQKTKSDSYSNATQRLLDDELHP
jgi:hypothetical protein